MHPKWVTLKKYCQEVGTTSQAIHNKRRTGMWMDGQQCKIGPDGNLYVNVEEVDKWVEQGVQGSLQRHRTA